MKTLTMNWETVKMQLVTTLFFSAFMIIMMQSAFAVATTSTSPMGDVLCSIVLIVYGNLGRGIATLAVVVIGVGATLGKTSWGLAITVAVGIAVIFNAHAIVNVIGGGIGGCIFT